jgi:nicotinamide mononucleotide transporter
LNQIVEIVSVLFGIAYILLAARGIIWCWPMGIVSSALGVWLFIDAKIYAEAMLFSYYVVMGVYGWYAWKGGGGKNDGLEISTWAFRTHVFVLLLGYGLTFGLAKFLDTYTDAEMPLLDSFTTVFSFIATWMVARKVLENWVYWIAIDFLSIYLYLSRSLEFYALLSLVYTVLAVYGYFNWRKEYLKNLLDHARD